MSDLRLYAPDECGADGYPLAWHATIKHAVREAAGHRCVRCRHPYRNGEHGKGEWSPCDERCRHRGPLRWLTSEGWLDLYDDVAAELIYDYGVRVEARWRILTVHHLDGNEANCRWWNLAALCQRDHLLIQGKVVMDRPWPWSHSGWFRPYVAGFYAFKYLGLELSRDETMARLDELLALGQQEESVERMAV